MNDYFSKFSADNSLVIYPYADPTNDTLLLVGYRLGARAIITELKNSNSYLWATMCSNV